MREIGTCLWFDGQAQEAADYYVSLFPNSEIVNVSHYPEGPRGEAGTVMTVDFLLNGRPFTALNGGPEYQFSSAISLMISCETQEEVDGLWARFTAEGEEVACGWLTDKFGLSWQIIPDGMGELMGGEDREGAARAMAAMLAMKKLDINAMRRAYNGEPL